MLSEMDLVNRDEFDAVKAMAIRARDENEKLEARLQALEAASTKTKTASRRKPTRGAKSIGPKKD